MYKTRTQFSPLSSNEQNNFSLRNDDDYFDGISKRCKTHLIDYSNFSPPISTYKSYKGFDFSKKFVESRFVGVKRKISLSQLENILQFFAIIDNSIDEKPVIAQKLIPICKLGKNLYDSEKLKEALLLSFKKEAQSHFWSEISNCIKSARLNGKKSPHSPDVASKKSQNPPKTDPIKRRSYTSEFYKQRSKISEFPFKRAIEFSDDRSYKSEEEDSEKDKPVDLLSEISDEYSDTTKEFKKLESKKHNCDDELNYSDVDEQEFNDLLNETEESEIFTSDKEKIKNKKNDHLFIEKVPSISSNKRRKKQKKQLDLISNKSSEYEYEYYSDEQVVKSTLTFNDLIKQVANKKFEYKEFQNIAEEVSSSKSFLSNESIDYENDEDLYIRTKRRWKHRHKRGFPKTQ